MSPENSPGGHIAHTPECKNPQPGWVKGSKKEIDPTLEERQDLSGEGYVGCVNCRGPAMSRKTRAKRNSKINTGA